MSSLLLPRQPQLYKLFNLMVVFAVLGPTLGVPLPGFKITMFRVAFILLAAGLILRWVNRKEVKTSHLYPLRWYTGFFVFWLVYAGISLTWVAHFGLGVRYFVFLATMLLLCLSFPFFVQSEKNIRQITRALFGVFFVIVVYGLIEALTYWHLPASRYYGKPYGDPTSFFTNQNDFATAITLGLPFLITAMYMFPMRRNTRILVYLTGIVALCSLIVTGSRSNTMFALPLAVFVWLALIPFTVDRRKLHRRNLLKGAALVLIAAAVVAGLTSTLLSDKTRGKLASTPGIFQDLQGSWQIEEGQGEVDMGEQASGDKSIAIRKHLIVNGFHFLRDSHYLGVGSGNIEFHMKGAPGVEDKTNMHNWWMEVLVTFGVPIFAMYMALYAWLLIRLWRLARLKSSPGVTPLIRWGATSSLIALTGYFFGGMSPSTAIHFTPMWIVYGFALAVIAVGERQRKGHHREASGGSGEV